MIRSMTGFGRARFDLEGLVFDVELRSVNQRHLDPRIRLPRILSRFEMDVRGRLQQAFARGKVELSVSAPSGASPTPRVDIDLELARQYVDAARTLHERYGVDPDLDADALLALPGVARTEEPELAEDVGRRLLIEAVDRAIEVAQAFREREGEGLEREFLERIVGIRAIVADLAAGTDAVVAAVTERLRKRALQLQDEAGLLDEARLHQEIVIAADRMDVAEELSRLSSHLDQFEETLANAAAGTPCGRRLDFLLQELSREANTLGAKSNDAGLAHRVVDLKTELERIREQVQNVE